MFSTKETCLKLMPSEDPLRLARIWGLRGALAYGGVHSRQVYADELHVRQDELDILR